MAIVDLLQKEYGLTTNKIIADVGAGTGISSELFLKTGFTVLAIEPNKEMREAAVSLLSVYPKFKAIDGSAEDYPGDNQHRCYCLRPGFSLVRCSESKAGI